MSFASLKRGSDFEKLKKNLEETNKPSVSDKDDSRFWVPTVDKVGNGMAIIRFLPGAEVDGDDAVPWVQVFKHGFKGPTGQWLIEHCPTTLEVGTPCPVCESNKELWETGIESNKEIVRKRKRALSYISNVLIISDPSFPENNGQVKLFKYGKKIFDKLEEKMTPAFPDEVPLNPFDLWRGANFKLKMRNVEGYRNYDKSEFEEMAAVSEDDSVLEEIWKKEYSLKEFVKPTLFKSYEKIKARLDLVLGVKKVSEAPGNSSQSFKVPDSPPKNLPTPPDMNDDDINYFKSLAEGSVGEDVPF